MNRICIPVLPCHGAGFTARECDWHGHGRRGRRAGHCHGRRGRGVDRPGAAAAAESVLLADADRGRDAPDRERDDDEEVQQVQHDLNGERRIEADEADAADDDDDRADEQPAHQNRPQHEIDWMREAELLRLLAHNDGPEERERRDDGVEERRAEVGGKRSGQPPECARHNERDPVDVEVDAVRRKDEVELRLEAGWPARAAQVERFDDLRQVAKARFQHAADVGAERAEVEGAGLAH